MDKVSSRHVSWADLESPTTRDIDQLARQYIIHPLVAQELLISTYRPKLEDFDDHFYLVLHFPVFDAKDNATLSREIDFVIFPYNLITVHYEDIPQLDEFQQLLAGHEALRERNFGTSSGQLLYHIISRLFLISLKELDLLDARIKNVEEKIFNGYERETLREISNMRRDLLNFQKALKPQQAILNSLALHSRKFFGQDIIPYFHDILGEYAQVWNSVEDLRETLDVLYETNISLLSANTNEVMKFLTAFTAILLPASIVIGLFGMNVTVPFADGPKAFWTIIGLVVFLDIIIYGFFKSKKWI